MLIIDPLHPLTREMLKGFKKIVLNYIINDRLIWSQLGNLESMLHAFLKKGKKVTQVTFSLRWCF